MTFSALQRRDVRLLAALRGASLLGDFVALTSLYLRLASAHHPWAIATLSIAASLPLVLLSPVAGQVVDRVAAKRLLVLLGLGEALICLGLARWHGLAPTLSLMFALSCLVAFSLPGYSALLPTLAGEENITRAQGLLQATQGGASILGPVVGGLLVGRTGQTWPLVLDAASFVVAALATSWLRHDRRPGPRDIIGEAHREGMMAGVTLIFRDGLLRPIEITVLVFMLGLGMVNVAEVFFVTQTLHGSATMYGLVGTSFGAGSIVGALAAQRLSQQLGHLARTVVVAITVIGAMMGVAGLVTRVGLLYPPLIVAGVAVGFANVAATTLFTVRTPERLRGRMFAALGATITGAEIGATALARRAKGPSTRTDTVAATPLTWKTVRGATSVRIRPPSAGARAREVEVDEDGTSGEVESP